MREFHLIDLIPIGFGLLSFLALLTAPGWGPDALALFRRCVEIVKARKTTRYVNDFEDDGGVGEDGVALGEVQTGAVPSAVPDQGTATCTEDTGFSVDDIPVDLTYEEIVTILARQEDAKGNHRWSGKKIYSFVGKNYGEFVTLMRVLRPKDTEPAEEPTILTPIAGRPTKASLYADPEFAYQPPPE